MPDQHCFFTMFDGHYVPRARALLSSMRRHVPAFRLFTLCLDERALAEMEAERDSRIVPLALPDFEEAEPDIRRVKDQRSRVEYYFLCSASLAHHLFERYPGPEMLTLLDADTFFFSSPDPVFAELEGHSIGITEHRFAARARSLTRFGRFNVGWISFRCDDSGRACARWWRESCIEWCFDRVEGGRFADQGYLNEWPERFEGVRVIQHPGVNLGPWNLGRHRLSLGDDAHPLVDGRPLIHYHFAEIKQLRSWLFSTNLAAYLTRPSRVARRHVYEPYLRELQRHAIGSDGTRKIRDPELSLGAVARFLRRTSSLALGILYNQYVVVRDPGGR